MAGILDIFGNLSPEQNQGLLAAAAQILQNSGPSRQPYSLGQAMGTGLQAYQQSTEAQRQKREAQERQAMQDEQARAQMEQAAQMRDLQMAGMRQSQGFAAEEAARARLPAPPQAVRYSTQPEWVVGKDGKPQAIVLGSDGVPKVLEGYRPYVPPSRSAAGGAGSAGVGMGQGKAPSGYRWTATGELEAIPGGPATKSSTATEGERKAGTLLMRLEGSEAQLAQALKEDPSAAKPSLLAQGLRGIGAEALANTSNNPARQRAEAAQLDILDAALTLGTGAAYTREQLEGYRRSYFPQIGDDPATIKDKQQRLNNVIQAAKIAAGRAAPAAEAAIPRQGGTTSNPFQGGAIPQSAAAYLKMNPRLRDAFDAKYGPGAAASILGK